MRSKTKLYFMLALIGVIVLALTFLFKNSLLDRRAAGMLCGLGSAMFALGLTKFTFSRSEEKNPKQMKQNEIEAKDERNIAIRYRAQALAGFALQWIAMGIAWISIMLDGPLWVTLSAVGAFCGKTILEFVLMGYYQRRM